MKHHISKILIAVAVSLFVMFIWPTRWHYEHADLYGINRLVRIDRLSGRTEYLVGSDWKPAAQIEPDPAYADKMNR
jgi:hypothetical protein